MSGLVRARPVPRGVPISTPDPVADALADAYYAQIDAEIDEGERRYYATNWKTVDRACTDPLLEGRMA